MATSVDQGDQRRRLQLIPTLGLTIVWVFVWGSYSLISLVGGVLLAVVVQLLLPLPPFELHIRVRPVHLFVLVVRFAWDVVRASIIVSSQSVAPWVHPRGHLLTIDLRTDDDLFAVITAEMTALVPGTVVVDLEPEKRKMTLHVFDADDAELIAVADRVRAQEERVLRALARDADEILGTTE